MSLDWSDMAWDAWDDYQSGHAEAFCCGYAGLRPTDTRPVEGPPDFWLRLPPTS
ncbi:hypothetical protein [Herbidospora mongoliensis]|uniref:hypothetical protein n=1 Tax=Herbidospora mongoliensis TaxID=688067 RepID=UPI000A5DC12F|nr:hypothetical protein [Herbidospora mongoliensis]